MKDEVNGQCRASVVEFKEVGKGLAFFEGDDGQEGISSEGQILSGLGSPMAMAVLLPSGGVAFVVVAIFNAPMGAGRLSAAGFIGLGQAGEEEAGVALGGLRLLFLEPVALHGQRRACTGKPGIHWGDGFHGSFARVDATVIPLQTQVKKGELSRACFAPLSRLEVFSLVPNR